MGHAARAAPYEKGTETCAPPQSAAPCPAAARAAPYEKGTETIVGHIRCFDFVRCRARGPL